MHTYCTSTHTHTHGNAFEEHIPNSLLHLCCCTHIRSSTSTVQLPATCFVFTGRDQTSLCGRIMAWQNLRTGTRLPQTLRHTEPPTPPSEKLAQLSGSHTGCTEKTFHRGAETAESCYIHNRGAHTHRRHMDKLINAKSRRTLMHHGGKKNTNELQEIYESMDDYAKELRKHIIEWICHFVEKYVFNSLGCCVTSLLWPFFVISA